VSAKNISAKSDVAQNILISYTSSV